MASFSKIAKVVADSSKIGKSAVSPRGSIGKAVLGAVGRTNAKTSTPREVVPKPNTNYAGATNQPGTTVRGIMPAVRGAVSKTVGEVARRANNGTKVAPMSGGGGSMRGIMPAIRGAVFKAVGEAVRRSTTGVQPFQKGGMAEDRAGRALRKKTPDAMGRAMAKAPMKKNMGGMAKKSSKKC